MHQRCWYPVGGQSVPHWKGQLTCQSNWEGSPQTHPTALGSQYDEPGSLSWHWGNSCCRAWCLNTPDMLGKSSSFGQLQDTLHWRQSEIIIKHFYNTRQIVTCKLWCSTIGNYCRRLHSFLKLALDIDQLRSFDAITLKERQLKTCFNTAPGNTLESYNKFFYDHAYVCNSFFICHEALFGHELWKAILLSSLLLQLKVEKQKPILTWKDWIILVVLANIELLRQCWPTRMSQKVKLKSNIELKEQCEK